MSIEQFYTVSELSTVLRIARTTIYEAIRTGKILSFKAGRDFRIPESQVLCLLKAIEDTSDPTQETLRAEKAIMAVRNMRAFLAKRQQWGYAYNHKVRERALKQLEIVIDETFLVCAMVGPLSDATVEQLVAAVTRLGDGKLQQDIRRRVASRASKFGRMLVNEMDADALLEEERNGTEERTLHGAKTAGRGLGFEQALAVLDQGSSS